LDDIESDTVRGCTGHRRCRTLVPGVVVWTHEPNVQRRRVAVRLDLIVVSPRVYMSPVLLPAEHRHWHANDFGLERDGLTLRDRLVVHASREAWRTRRLTSYSER